MKAILLVDHGSRRDAANEALASAARLVQSMVGAVIVRHAHMELAPPTIAEAFAQCVAAGATEIVVFPYFLGEGRHVSEDIPRLVLEAAERHPGVAHRVVAPFGGHPGLAEIVLERTGTPRTAR